MKNIIFSILSVLIFSACANVERPAKVSDSYIGVKVPNFNNDKIDSLVMLYEADRALFYKAQAERDMQSYYKEKIKNKDNYNVTGFYDDVIRILNADADPEELAKFQDYISESSAKSKEFMNKLKE